MGQSMAEFCISCSPYSDYSWLQSEALYALDNHFSRNYIGLQQNAYMGKVPCPLRK
jgi:hypothetical protein